MSFIHNLTIGILDEAAVQKCQAVALEPLGPECCALIQRYADPGSLRIVDGIKHFEIENQPALITSEIIRVRLYSPQLREGARQVALTCAALGYLVADVRHARIVPSEKLECAGAIVREAVS